MRANLNLTVAMAAWLAFAGCGRFPRDPEGTLDRVKAGALRVGLVENAPWVYRRNREPAGAEVALVRKLADELGAKPEWHWGGEQAHLEALEHFQLDLVIGGITRETEWRKKVGLTSAYLESRVLVGFPAGTAPPEKLKGVPVAVKAGSAIGGYLERKGALPQPLGKLRESTGAIAGEEWELELLGRAPSKFELTKAKHALATPPGENGWIKLLDEFLHSHAAEAKQLLQQEEARP
jgi:polar amino acid transport system substrate-binding protein